MTEREWPEFGFPEAEQEVVRAVYSEATVILEYGSGGSTIVAAEKPGKLVFSVESDRDWAVRLQREIDCRELASPATVYHVDIGPVGDWGRPLNADSWMSFPDYPLAIWDEDFFRQPDVVLIDGRFRPACFMAVALRTHKRVKVLWDDYVSRPAYKSVEEFLKPSRTVGRMAIFDVEPRQLASSEIRKLMDNFFRATYHATTQSPYDTTLRDKPSRDTDGRTTQ